MLKVDALYLVRSLFLCIVFSAAGQCKSIQDTLLSPVRAVVDQHRTEATHYDGPRCPMYPSCSGYAAEALEQKGLFGFFLSIDRLFFREFGRLSDRFYIAPRNLSRHPRYYDPLTDSLGKRPSLIQEEF